MTISTVKRHENRKISSMSTRSHISIADDIIIDKRNNISAMPMTILNLKMTRTSSGSLNIKMLHLTKNIRNSVLCQRKTNAKVSKKAKKSNKRSQSLSGSFML